MFFSKSMNASHTSTTRDSNRNNNSSAKIAKIAKGPPRQSARRHKKKRRRPSQIAPKLALQCELRYQRNSNGISSVQREPHELILWVKTVIKSVTGILTRWSFTAYVR